MKTNYYEVLGVARTATEKEIRDRFRQLARENHPDRHLGSDKASAERSFQTLTEALNVLMSSERRQRHDAELQTGGSSQPDATQVAKVYLGKGAKAYKEGDFVAATENFDMAVKHNPQDARAFHHLALAAAKVPDMRKSVQAIEIAVLREPLNPLYLKDAGVLCKRAGLRAKAERYLEEALKWDRDNVVIQSELAELQKSRGAREPSKGLFDSLFKKG